MKEGTFSSTRLRLRQWQDSDRKIFAAMNSDPLVMKYFPRHYSEEQSNAFVDENANHIKKQGWGAWAVEEKGSHKFIGFVGFLHPAPWHPCAGSIDIGWRLAERYWGQGYATEAATKALKIAFEEFDFEELISYTSEINHPSIRVMQKIGMTKDPVGFNHPKIEEGNPLREHVVYRISLAQWRTENT